MLIQKKYYPFYWFLENKPKIWDHPKIDFSPSDFTFGWKTKKWIKRPFSYKGRLWIKAFDWISISTDNFEIGIIRVDYISMISN